MNFVCFWSFLHGFVKCTGFACVWFALPLFVVINLRVFALVPCMVQYSDVLQLPRPQGWIPASPSWVSLIVMVTVCLRRPSCGDSVRGSNDPGCVLHLQMLPNSGECFVTFYSMLWRLLCFPLFILPLTETEENCFPFMSIFIWPNSLCTYSFAYHQNCYLVTYIMGETEMSHFLKPSFTFQMCLLDSCVYHDKCQPWLYMSVTSCRKWFVALR